MKIYLTDEETLYLHNMIDKSLEFYEQYVRAAKLLAVLHHKTTPPRSHINLGLEEKVNLIGLVTQAIAIAKKPGDDATDIQKAHLATLTSIRGKLELSVETPSL